MSRSETRAKRRVARHEQRISDFSQARKDPAALAALLKRLAASDIPIWPIAEAVSRSSPLDAAERAMIAQVVAPHLAGRTPGSVVRRQENGSKFQVSGLRSGN